MRRRLPEALAVAAAATAIALLVGTGLGWWSSTPTARASGPLLAVSTSLTPASSFFGDPLAAEAAVELDTRRVEASGVHVDASFGPYAETAPPVVTRSRTGTEETIVYRYALQCVTSGCLPTGRQTMVKLPPVVVTATSGTRRLRASAVWPSPLVVSRLTDADLARSGGVFQHATTAPPPTFALSPGPLAIGLTAAAALLGAGAVGLLLVEAARVLERRRRRAAAKLTSLEWALALAREAADRLEPADRRKALGLLAETLAVEGRAGLATSAGEAAWSAEAPSPSAILGVVDEVEATGGPGSAP